MAKVEARASALASKYKVEPSVLRELELQEEMEREPMWQQNMSPQKKHFKLCQDDFASAYGLKDSAIRTLCDQASSALTNGVPTPLSKASQCVRETISYVRGRAYGEDYEYLYEFDERDDGVGAGHLFTKLDVDIKVILDWQATISEWVGQCSQQEGATAVL